MESQDLPTWLPQSFGNHVVSDDSKAAATPKSKNNSFRPNEMAMHRVAHFKLVDRSF